jgi:general secretion pathway protein K
LTTSGTADRETGFALLLVLWALILLSLIITQLLTAGRRETQLAGNLRHAATAEILADSAVQNTIFQLMTGGRQPAGTLKLPGGVATIRVRNLAGLVNPNLAPAPMLAALIEECGIAPAMAQRVTQSITDWRSPPDDPRKLAAAYRAAGRPYAPSGQAFQTRDEVRLVLGMTPTIADCLTPHLSVFGDEQMPSIAFADPFVLRSLVRMAQASGTVVAADSNQQGDQAVEIIADATTVGARFTREATVRFPRNSPLQPYRILTWRHED